MNDSTLFKIADTSNTIEMTLLSNTPYMLIIGRRGYQLFDEAVGVYIVGGYASVGYFRTLEVIANNRLESISYENINNGKVNMIITFKEAFNYAASAICLE